VLQAGAKPIRMLAQTMCRRARLLRLPPGIPEWFGQPWLQSPHGLLPGSLPAAQRHL